MGKLPTRRHGVQARRLNHTIFVCRATRFCRKSPIVILNVVKDFSFPAVLRRFFASLRMTPGWCWGLFRQSLASHRRKSRPQFPRRQHQFGRQFGNPFHDVGHVGLHRLLKWPKPLHEGRVRGSQSGREHLVDLRRLDLNHQSQGSSPESMVGTAASASAMCCSSRGR